MTDKPINKEERDNYLTSYLWKRKTGIDFLVISQNKYIGGGNGCTRYHSLSPQLLRSISIPTTITTITKNDNNENGSDDVSSFFEC